jgi:23S rRNA (uracil-5-)-methyltransferase RumA
MKFGDKAVVKITDVDKKGRGCGLVGERKACANFTVPGEEVEARLVARKQGVLRMEVENVLVPSPHRVAPRCPYVGKCGGCAWQQFDYGYQLELKRGLVNKALEAGGLTDRIDAVVPSPDLFYYRNRMDYCVGWKGELGLKEPGRWNTYVDLEECHLLSPGAVEVMRVFRSWMRENAVVPWDVKKHTGYARYLVIREGKRTGKRMVTIVTAEGELPRKDALVSALASHATTVYHGVNPTITDLSIVSRLELLHGEQFLEETVDGMTFAIHPNAFFQTNTAMAERLVGTVREFLGDRKPRNLLDLYCGVGLFGICLAGDAERVVGVEIDEQAIEMARANAARNGIANAEYFASKAESLIWEKEKPDVVIVDPPRSGLHPKVVATLLANAPERIAYVSCNYESFVRDFLSLAAKYRITRLASLDLFPHSAHVELVVMLEKK